MSYDGKIMRRALARFSEDKQRRQNQADQRRRALFAQEPRLAEIDRELRGTMSRIISSALRRGTDPVPAIRVIRDDNLSLQRERRELLEKLGYPADYLEERPRCPLCGDTGYRDGRVCSCLQSYYAREQIQELSRMLDVGSQSFETFRLDYYSPDRGSLSARRWSTTSPSAAAMPTALGVRAAISCSSAHRGWGRRSSRPASRAS